MATTCQYCNSSVRDGDAFCQSCGRAVGDVVSSGPYEAPAAATVTGAGAPAWATRPVPGGLPAAAANGTGPAPNAVAAAPGGANDAYLGRRLTYSPQPEPTFDPLGSARFIGQLGLRALLYYVVCWVVSGVFWVLLLLTNHSNFVNHYRYPYGQVVINAQGQEAEVGPAPLINGFGWFLVIAFVLILLFLTLSFWFLKVPIQLSEWKLTVDGQGAAAPLVFSHIAAVLYERRTPIESLRVQRFRLPRTGERDYLELNHQIFYGYVACFPFGQDLYIGWTFWSKLSPFRYLCMFVARIWRSVFNRGSDLYVSLRYDTARAMRETMHSATREGADVAVGRLQAHGQGIIGSAIPVMEHAVAE